MEDRVKGAWIVHHAHKIEEHGVTGSLDGLRRAGDCGVLLSALCATQQTQLRMDRVKTLAQAAGIDLTYQLPQLLDILKEAAIVQGNEGAVEVLGLTTQGVLEHTAKIYGGLSPGRVEDASIEVAEICSDAPRTEAELREYVGDHRKLDSKEAAKLMATIEKVGFCDSENLDASTKVYFNGALFRGNDLKKTKAVLNSLGTMEQQKITTLEQRLKAEGCVEKTQAISMLGETLFRKVHSIGMYDVNTVSNSRENVEYLTKPAAFNKFGRADVSDAFDLAKAFVASLEYGMTRSISGRGRIRYLDMLMRKLIAGETLRPCTAAGEDYHVLEMKGVVQVIPAQSGMFSMKLLKQDIGQMALQVLESGDASEQSLDVLPGSPMSRYRGPESNRVKARKDARVDDIDVRDALATLRTQSI